MKDNKNNTFEFSKKLIIGVFILSVLVIGFTCYIVFTTGDTSSIPVLLGIVGAELAAATGFYYNKAKKENAIKLKKELITTILSLQAQYSEEDVQSAKELENEVTNIIDNEYVE